MAKVSNKRKTVDSLYIGKSTIFKIFLLVGVVIISALFIWYTFDVIDALKKDTRSQVEKVVKFWQLAVNSNLSGTELQFIFDEIIVKANFPIIVLDEDRNPIQFRNIKNVEQGDYSEETMVLLKKVSKEMVEKNGEFPILYTSESGSFINYFCYGDSSVINELKVMPFVEIGIILTFMIVAMIGFQNIKKSEERLIWVGMAKETAHQLGTPISSLMGWLEILKTEKETESIRTNDEQLFDETMSNMKTDVVRLEKVANRFGKIGSIPELSLHSLNSLVEDTVEYYRRRLPFEGNGIQIHFDEGKIPDVTLNPELLGWALENIIKNALQAVDPKTGVIHITTELSSNAQDVIIRILDNGKGITAAAARQIFRAGFTTKKRGWGLGLTLVKRIIEEYHGGKISLKKSKPGETLFELHLPVSEQ